eukprot:4665845-Amphidinium_carterae.3
MVGHRSSTSPAARTPAAHAKSNIEHELTRCLALWSTRTSHTAPCSAQRRLLYAYKHVSIASSGTAHLRTAQITGCGGSKYETTAHSQAAK